MFQQELTEAQSSQREELRDLLQQAAQRISEDPKAAQGVSEFISAATREILIGIAQSARNLRLEIFRGPNSLLVFRVFVIEDERIYMDLKSKVVTIVFGPKEITH